jgi:hypothetical protein
MVDTQALEFFNSIHAKTKDGKVPWQPTADENEYVASVGGEFSLVITRAQSKDAYGRDINSHFLTMKDKDNRKLISAMQGIDGITQEALRELFMAAERHALKVGEKLGRLLDQLDRL